ncbi:hypothetical protein G7Z17_g3898 [Cylindrodendrum hubeiense]|uniref:Heterokaryon incompatibility domain-containing protein n=1 Tax=Cylindrodendrum hubeiense TaxID=595255 RepID=A0A9P5HEZ5_9HYPO|nr:hypothetical protein G7Z17_g3898 [Cylindrodendrum hubeiense]
MSGLANLRLCWRCEAVPSDLDLDHSYDHSDSLEALQKSASGDKYCHLCQMMWESIIQGHQKQRFHLGSHPILSETWPVRLYGLPNPTTGGTWRGYDAIEIRSGDRSKGEDSTWVTTMTMSRTEYPVVSRLYLHKGGIENPLLYTSVGVDDKSPTSFGIASRWLETCINHHTHHTNLNMPSEYPSLPTRVIDVDATLSHVKLAVKGLRPREKAQFTALSYCWGKSKATVTTVDNLTDHIQVGIACQSLPLAIQDAIKLTRGLSIRYLWVDALCILQGSAPEAVQDWLSESSKMSQIYGDATLVIAAADSQDCQEEFLASRQLSPTTQHSRDGIPGRSITSAYRHTTRKGFVDLKTNTWSTRAWTLQEVALSQRALIYTNQQLYWKCPNGLVGSDGYLSVLPRINALQKVHLDNDWTQIVMEYSRRLMTNPADKLPVVSGLALLHCSANGYTYAAGICQENIWTELLWRTEHSEKLSPKRALQWRAPSWSWASIDGPIDYDLSDIHSSRQRGEGDLIVNRVHLEYVNHQDPYGRATGGWLSAQGRMQSATKLVLDQYHSAGDVYDGGKMLGRAYADEKRQWTEFEEVKGPLWLFLVTGGAGLLLKPHTDGRDGEFVRIGAFFLSRTGKIEAPHWNLMDIKLL